MTSGAKTVTVFLTVICGLLLTVVGVSARWPVWAWAALAVLLVALPVSVVKAATRRGGPVPVEMIPHITEAPVERREERVTGVALPSLWEDYDFLFSATVRWCPTGAPSEEPVLNPAGLAVDAILDRARDITEKREPGRASLVQHELNGALGRMRPDATGSLHVMAESVTLVLPEHDRERLERLAAVRKDKAVWEHQRKHEQSKREYLGEDVLKDTGSAVVWWLAKNDEQVDKTVRDIGLLAQLASAANDTDVPERLRHLVPQPPRETTGAEASHLGDFASAAPSQDPGASTADRYDAFLRAMGLPEEDARRYLVTRHVAEAVKAQGLYETAEELLRRFDAPEGPEASAPDDSDLPDPPPGGTEDPTL
ncbi:hypothetical protein [Streptomyces macrosporus]|uniref:Secreted protein n=1 Tax=Streptomyces macrosporus TaxID=44032 RepID=A0ABP5XIF5_9ACTN